MKKLTILLVAVLGLASYSSKAQIGGFATNAFAYFTTINTNYSFSPFKLWTEGDYMNNVNFADSINVSYDLLKPASYTSGVSVDTELGMRNAGIAGTIVDGHGGFALAYNYYDVRVEGYADGVYQATINSGSAEIGMRFFKKPTPNTLLGLTLGVQIPTAKGPNYPIIGILAGATF